MPLFSCNQSKQNVFTFVSSCVIIQSQRKGKTDREGEGDRNMRKYRTEEGFYVTEFQNITELVHFIETNEVYPNFKNKASGPDSISGDKRFTETENFEEAKDLLLHGWEHGTREIKGRMEAKETGVNMKQKTVYDVVGYQCSVPRYLQGIPTNMINKKAVSQKNKVITINKMCSYSACVSSSTMKTESVKVLQLVNRLEKQGYRVNLNVIFGSRKRNTVVTKVRIKTSSQRLNIKQTAFPLVHPSMLRRMIFAVWERSEECSYGGFEYGYGRVCDNYAFSKTCNKGEYLIPSVLSEKAITEIEPYKIK
jgi:hypothetical protein|nr:MAG TPA: hypothetical protein [Caudoviricetes sp.]